MPERTSDADLLDPVFLERWSPRSFSHEPVSDAELAAVFEAARWAPSWMNNQPWHFVYGTDGPDRDAILAVFNERNRDWAQRAPVVGLVVAITELDGAMGRTRDFDTGAATMAMLIQATKLGLSAHLLGGIDLERAHDLVGLDPEDGSVVCGFVLGRRGPADVLHEKLQERETPSQRKPASDFAIKGSRLRR
jgi:nitroreductase